MAERTFLDTNILLYSISLDPAEQGKRIIAQQLLDAEDGHVLSMQVLHEFYNQATHDRRRDAISPKSAWRLISSWERFDLQENSFAILASAHALRARTGYSIWDCLILAAAIAQGCAIVYSEDMQDGRIIDGLRIVDPFKAGALPS